eukprot:scaffold129553_cov36-Tisochrysis_lutea.AAC.5
MQRAAEVCVNLQVCAKHLALDGEKVQFLRRSSQSAAVHLKAGVARCLLYHTECRLGSIEEEVCRLRILRLRKEDGKVNAPRGRDGRVATCGVRAVHEPQSRWHSRAGQTAGHFGPLFAVFSAAATTARFDGHCEH